MARIEISITDAYIQNWSTQEGLREVLQNGQDEAEARPDHPMRVHYSARKQTLTVTSEGVTIDRAALLLGETSKRGTKARGQFGEGLALGLLALVRAGHPVRIENGTETWTPDLEYSEAWGRSVLTIQTRALGTPRPHLRIKVGALPPAAWTECIRRTLFLPGALRPDERTIIPTDRENRVLLDRPGEIYVRGLWVAAIPKLAAGYDLADVEIDRDRRMIDAWDLCWRLGALWTHAIAQSTTRAAALNHVHRALEGGHEDTDQVAHHLRYDEDARKAIAAHFVTTHGETALPVADTTTADKATAAGLRPIPMTAVAVAVLEAALGQTAADAIAKAKRTCPIVPILRDDLNPTEAARWTYVEAVARSLMGDRTPPLAVASLPPDVVGCLQDGRVYLDRSLLGAPAPGEAVVTLVHELAHATSGAGDLTAAHHALCEALTARLVNHLAGDRWPAPDAQRRSD